jgi:hypothetical protein
MTTPDQRIRLPGAKIDFSTEVGTTGQDHDTFPAPGQARYDHMRMYLLGLLSNQASYNEPTQYREGSFWFDLNTLTIKQHINGAWSSLSEAILLDQDGSTVTSLADWYKSTVDVVNSIKPDVTFSGAVTTVATVISIPSTLTVTGLNRCFLWVNGKLVDPRKCQLIGGNTPTSIKLPTSLALAVSDTFTVVLKHMASKDFYVTDVVV